MPVILKPLFCSLKYHPLHELYSSSIFIFTKDSKWHCILLSELSYCSKCHVFLFYFTFNHSDLNNSLRGADGIRADAQVCAGIGNLHIRDEQCAVVSALRSSLVRFRRKLIHYNTKNFQSSHVHIKHIYPFSIVNNLQHLFLFLPCIT